MSPGRAHFLCFYFETALLLRQEGRTNSGGVTWIWEKWSHWQSCILYAITWIERERGRGREGEGKSISCANKLAILKSRVAFYSKVTSTASATADSRNKESYLSSRLVHLCCYRLLLQKCWVWSYWRFGFLYSLQENSVILPLLSQTHFLQNPFQFIIY
jgi:hypothetical protein